MIQCVIDIDEDDDDHGAETDIMIEGEPGLRKHVHDLATDVLAEREQDSEAGDSSGTNVGLGSFQKPKKLIWQNIFQLFSKVITLLKF